MTVSTEPQTVSQRYPLLPFAVVLAVTAAVLFYAWHTASAGTGARPLLTGVAESGTFWKGPMSNASNEGFSVKGHRVEVYESVVVATNPETGLKHVRPHGFYSELAVK